jgi:hypothetical protein
MAKKLEVFEVPWSEVWRAVDACQCREHFNKARRGAESPGKVADALTWCEDWLEVNRPRIDRAPLTKVRRKCERD